MFVDIATGNDYIAFAKSESCTKITLAIVLEGVHKNSVTFFQELEVEQHPEDIRIVFPGEHTPPVFHLYIGSKKYISTAYGARFGLRYQLEIALFSGSTLVDLLAKECVFLPNDSLTLFEDYAKSQAIKQNIGIFSAQRFYNALRRNRILRDLDYQKTNFFLSGFGAGGEIAALLASGARSIVCFDPDRASMAIAQRVYREFPQVAVIDKESNLAGTLVDVTISRHVIEHVPAAQQRHYIDELISQTKVGGHVVVEFPNFNHPVDPHTDTYFFHLLPMAQRQSISRYFRRTKLLPESELLKLDSLANMSGMTEHRLRELVGSRRTIEFMYYDFFQVSADTDFPTTIEAVIST